MKLRMMFLASMFAIFCILAGCTSEAEPTTIFSKDEVSPAESQSEAADKTSSAGVHTIIPLDILTFNLPNGITERRDSDSQKTFMKNSFDAGGVFLLECESEIFDDVLNCQDSLTPLVHGAMEDLGISEWEWCMSNSSVYGLLEFHMGNAESEYVTYFVRGRSTCYVFWFDRNLISTDEETSIMDSLNSDDITDELNMISTQAFADSIAESMAQEKYQLEVILPAGIVEKDQTEDGALFYQNGNLVGGYKTIHFEKGILPAVHENQNLILESLKEYLMDQIDLSDYSGEIIDEALITARFNNGDTEYTHYILSYGQVGTQYDIWFNEKMIDSNTVTSIISKAQLVNTGNIVAE